jgi:LuxR family maltose regulon positive regulatory protein
MKVPQLIVQTKLIPPRVKTGILLRRRPLNLLKKNLDKNLILICSDAGYGKTTLLSQLCQELKEPYLYYALEPSDNDITTFFNYIIAGVRLTNPKFGKRVRSIIGQTQSVQIMVGTFINEFVETINKDFYIILDDYHHLHLNKEIAKALEYLLQHQPANIHLVISSRATPPFDLSFYLAKQELFRIEKEQLQFRRHEISDLLKKVFDMELSEADLARVEEHSEGWITAIQLIIQKAAAIGEIQIKETLNGYVASGEELFSYFAREVFKNQSRKTQTFLLKTSFVDRMEPEICNQLLGIRDSRAVLKKLEDEQIFTTRVGSGTYNYHHLFQKFINGLARQTYSNADINTIYAKIARYFLGKNDIESAIDYYLYGSHYRKAAKHIKSIADTFIKSCRFNRLLHWLDILPSAHYDDDLCLTNIKGNLQWYTMHLDEARSIFKHIIQLAKKRKDHKNLFSAYYGTAKTHTSSGDFQEVLKYLKKCHKIPTIKKKDLVETYNLEGICYIYLNNFRKAEVCFDRASEILRKHGAIEQNASLLNNMAIIAFTKGELETSLKMFKKLVASKTNILAQPHVYSNIALTYIDLGRLREGREALIAAYRMSRQFVNERAYHMFLLGLGFYHLEQNNYNRAERCFKRLLKISKEKNERLSELKAKHGLMKMHYLAGNLGAAQSLANEMVEKDNIKLGIRHHDGFLLKGLIELDLGDLRNAEATLIKSLTAVEGTDFKYSLMRNYYYLAGLYLVMKNEKKAKHFLAPALRLARENNYDYFLIRTAKKMHLPIEFAARHGVERQYAESIMLKILADSNIKVRFFGNFEVSMHGAVIEPARWQTRKAQLIFAYIILNRKRPIAKEDLMHRFSTQESPSHANQEIRTTISRIQKALPWSKFLRYERGFYKVSDKLVLNVDTEEFEDLSRLVIQKKDRPDKKTIEYALRAIAFYRDDFLVVFYDNWCEEMRVYLRDQYITVLNIVAKYSFKNSEYDKALSIYHKIIEKEPLHEETNSSIIRCYLALQKKPEALRHYNEYKKRLQQELQIVPSQAMEKLVHS